MKRVIRFCNLCILSFLLTSQILISQEFQTLNSNNNNKLNPELGSKGSQLLRVTDYGYGNGINSLGGEDRMNPRAISNLIFDQEEAIFDKHNLSDFTWVFGQFLDHDITFVETSTEDASILVQPGDEFFPENSFVRMARSAATLGTGTSIDNPREHTNLATAFIDGSAIYGSDIDRANWLRTFNDGTLKTSKYDLLPWNTVTGELNDRKDLSAPDMVDDTGQNIKLFVAGDLRANENPLLIGMHTLFVREHNRLCDELKAENQSLTDDQLYQMARRHVVAYLQNIVYSEWLPTMGVHLPEYKGYNSNLEVGVFNVFSSAAFRLGHTLINSNIIRMGEDGEVIPRGNIELKDAFFKPGEVHLARGIDPFFQGMATQIQQELDCKMVDDVRNFLFDTPEAGGLDLAAINIQRGRERGLPDYNTIRQNFGLPGVNTFKDITNEATSAELLENIYGTVNDIDPWVGLLAEYHMPDAMFGQTLMMIISRQFQLLRDGDRFYFENDPIFSTAEMEMIKRTSFKEIILRNTSIKLMQDNVFEAMEYENIPNGPEIEAVQLAAEVYPNPTSDFFTIKVFSNEDAQLNVSFIDNNGRLVLRDSKEVFEGENSIDYNINNTLAKGIYSVLLEESNNFSVIKLVVD